MRTYLDPHLYSFSGEEWISYSFVARLQALIDMMLHLREFEEKDSTGRLQLRIRSTGPEMERIYASNPLINEPSIPVHYKQQFTSNILPELMRRFEPCPLEACEPVRQLALPIPTAADQTDGLAQQFIASLEACRACGDYSGTCLLQHSDRKSIADDSPFFDLKIMAGSRLEIAALSGAGSFPVSTENNDEALNLALEIERARAALSDPQWADLELNPVLGTSNFWKSLSEADFQGLDSHYKARIMHTLLQIATGRCTTAYFHRMNNESFKVGAVDCNRWNAYVFQSGASDQDRRCSRIYYGHIGNAVYLDTYDQDAH